jgi:hypothetical protein
MQINKYRIIGVFSQEANIVIFFQICGIFFSGI